LDTGGSLVFNCNKWKKGMGGLRRLVAWGKPDVWRGSGGKKLAEEQGLAKRIYLKT